MNVLLVTPSEIASGEAIGALHLAEDLSRDGCRVRFLASAFTARFLTPRFGGAVTELGSSRPTNQALWSRTVRSFDPQVVVFADYPLLFFASGIAPLADDRWVADLDSLAADLVTLDHLGYAQGPRWVFFGPAHRSMHAERTPVLPARMRVLLPCPVNEPGPVAGRAGIPFRSIALPLEVPAGRRAAARDRFVPAEGLLVVHLASRWAWMIADLLDLPYFHFLDRLLAGYLDDCDRPVRVVSVNSGDLLGAGAPQRGVEVINVAGLAPDDFEALLLSADLVLTENAVSAGLGKAACGMRPCAVMANSFRLPQAVDRADAHTAAVIQDMERHSPGAVFPWEVFPIWSRDDLDEVGVFRDSSYPAVFRRVEAFGGDRTAANLHRLLLDGDEQEALRQQQSRYAEAVGALPGPAAALRAACTAPSSTVPQR